MVELMETLGEAHIVLITAASAERLPAACEDVYYLKKLKSNETVEEVTSNVDDL